jgi:hypothetical protein
MMSVFTIVALAIGAWGQRLAGAFLVGPLLTRRPVLARAASLVPAAVVAAVVVQLAIGKGRDIVVDERLAGLAVAGFLVWRRAPFIVVVVGAALATAGLRAVL